MYTLTDSAGSIPSVGPKYKELLRSLNITTIEDLIYHFPFRYDDFSTKKNISDVLKDETVSIEAILGPVENIFTKYRKRLTKTKLVDPTGSIEVIWFNQHYIKKVLIPGRTYNFSGKIGSFNNKNCLISPNFEIVEEGKSNLNTGRLVPVYPETAGVSSKWLRSKIHYALGRLDIEEFLPKEILDEKKFGDIRTSFNHIHFPKDVEEADKAKKRFQFEELFMELLTVEKRKRDWKENLKGIRFEMDKKKEEQIKSFISKLPFELTDSQKDAIDEISKDLDLPHPMNRLLEGDVGTGKTMVAILASYIVFLSGYKSLYMAPTEILAKQHYTTFQNFLTPFGIKIGLRTGSTKENHEDFDILIGTHSLLFSEENYSKIGLVIIDEQHRFGVEQRGKIMSLGRGEYTPHLLSMTATPIPRTLALTLYGDLSISLLKGHPNKERKITTKVVIEKGRQQTYEIIRDKKEQTFIVCPLIETSESIGFENVKAAEKEYEELQKGVFKDIPMGLLHGRIKPKEKEEIVNKFRSGEIRILVSTPVIEVGIDVPEATIMVIESAERYGLASLHQLRGRVGRGSKEGFCFVFMSNNYKSSYLRLKNLETIDNGTELADLDMKMRGQGDIFGTMQHGTKRLRIADLFDIEMLNDAKKYASEYFDKLNVYTALRERLTKIRGEYIPNN